MAQFQSPETYVDGQQVTAARLNNQTNGAVALPGLITDQTNITANTVASGDSVLLYDLSATALREATAGDLLGSNVPVTTSAVTAGANSDVVVTPNDGTIVTGQAYTSADGLTVTVTSTAHGLVVGQVILVSAAATGYNGTFRVATVATNSFTYVMPTAATAGSSTLSYIKKGAIRNAGSESVTGSLFVAGTAVISGSTAVTGATTLTGALTASGTANFTGAVQYDGVPVYGLTSVTEIAVPYTIADASTSLLYATTCNQYIDICSFTGLTKTNKEIWVFEADFNGQVQAFGTGKYAITKVGPPLEYLTEVIQNANDEYQIKLKVVVPASVTFTGETYKLRLNFIIGAVGAYSQQAAYTTGAHAGATKIFRLTKYQTA